MESREPFHYYSAFCQRGPDSGPTRKRSRYPSAGVFEAARELLLYSHLTNYPAPGSLRIVVLVVAQGFPRSEFWASKCCSFPGPFLHYPIFLFLMWHSTTGVILFMCMMVCCLLPAWICTFHESRVHLACLPLYSLAPGIGNHPAWSSTL